ncbi:MAG: cell surface protein, partial [Lactococcus cremoris]
MKEWHGMVLAKNKKIMISTISLVILSLVCFKENLPAQASTKSLDTGESFTEVYNKDNGFYLN